MRRLLQLCLIIIPLVIMVGAAQATTYEINYHLSQPGNVSLAVYSPTGILVRELQRAAPQSAGDHTATWDGLDNTGSNNNGVTGTYTWKLLETPGLTSHFLMNLGNTFPLGGNLSSSGGVGSHYAPYSVAVDSTGVYVAANSTENIETCTLKMSLDGSTRTWSQQAPTTTIPWDGALSLASDGGNMYLLAHGGATGSGNPQLLCVSNASTGAYGITFNVSWSGTDVSASDMAICNGVLVVAYASQNAIRWYNPATGAVLDTATVSNPQGVAVGSNGTVYVTTGNSVVSVTEFTHNITTLNGSLTSPGRLAVDNSNGNILVYQGGTSSQVVRLDNSGNLLNTYGAAGGRLDGLYNAQNFEGVTGLCADGSSGFYVAEAADAPRRVSHFANNGTVIAEWYGGQRWSPGIAFEPGDNTHVWVTSAEGNPDIMRLTVNYATKTWTVHSCYHYSSLAGGAVGDTWNDGTGQIWIYQHAGTNYLVLQAYADILKIDSTNWKLAPVTIIPATYLPVAEWNDLNGNGLEDPGETTTYTAGIPPAGPTFIDANFNFYYFDGSAIRELPVSWNTAGKVGLPFYGAPPGPVVASMPPRYITNVGSDDRWDEYLYHDTATGNLYGGLNPGTVNWGISVDSFMQQWNTAGTATWGVGELGPNNGQIHNDIRSIAGTTSVTTNTGSDSCVVATDFSGCWSALGQLAETYVWDQDGLFVGGIMDNTDSAGPPYLYQDGGEFCKSALYTDGSGNVYFYGNWENCVRVHQVTGWTNWYRTNGSLTITTPSTANTGQGLNGQYFDNEDFTDLRTTRVDGPVNFNWGTSPPTGTGITSPNRYGVRWTGTVLPTYGPQYVGSICQQGLGSWTVVGDAQAYGGSFRYSDALGLSASFKFHGTSISVLGLTGPNCGEGTYSIDGGTPQTFDSQGATAVYQTPLFPPVTGLTSGDHTVTIVNLGVHDGASSDNRIYIDAFTVDGATYDDGGLPYTFYVNSEDGDELWVNNNKAIIDWYIKTAPSEKASAPIQLLRQPTPIQLSYFMDTGGSSTVDLSWSSPWDTKTPIPAAQLYPETTGTPIPELGVAGCMFVGKDTTTQGTWINTDGSKKYGNDGYNVINLAPSYPNYVTVTPTNNTVYGEAYPTTDPRALQTPDRSTRIAYAWTGQTFTIDLNFTDGNWHQFGLYALDWFNNGLLTDIKVTDSTGTQVLDSEFTGLYQNGEYILWNLRGHVQVVVACDISDPYTTNEIHGLFFDPPGGTMPIIKNQWLSVSGNGVVIPDGTQTPDAAYGTNFGTVTVGSNASQTYTIANTGSGVVNLNGTPLVAISGTNAADFSVTTLPTTPVAATNGTTTFVVKFTPAASGLRSAHLTIANDSNDEPYDFAIQGTGNTPPTCSLTAPANNATFNTGSNITLTASAADSDGTVSQVQFYQGATLLGTVTSSPYNYTWNSVPHGNYSLTAKAIDNNGAVTTSSAVNIVVNTPPTCSLTAPANNAVYIAPASIALTASASDSDGSISKVQFYQGTTLLGTVTSSPYTFTWSSPPSGLYSITAEAYDNQNATTTSSAAKIYIFTNADIGSPSPAGSGTYASPTFTVKGGGNDIAGTSDQFHYLYLPITGNCTIIARAASVSNSNAWAKGSVMMREVVSGSNAAGSRTAVMELTPTTTNGVSFQYRATQGGTMPTQVQHTGVAPPYWLKLVRSGNNFTASYSSNGTSWTALVTNQAITMNTAAYIGLAVSSHVSGTLCTATFDNVSITQP